MKIYIHTIGCKVNQYETQVLKEFFEKQSNIIVNNFTLADLCIINSCSVTHNADSDCRKIIRRILKENNSVKIIVTGCLNPKLIEDIKKISDKIEIKLKEEILGENYRNITICNFYDHSRAFVKIQDGCDAFCSYCIIPLVRNKMWSKSKDILFKEINQLLERGYKEIVLCGIRLGKYNDNGYNLSHLLKDLCLINKNFYIRLSSLEITDINDTLIDIILKNHKIRRHLHLPLQSGDNDILKLMFRPYTAEEYKNKIFYIKSKIENICITTDIMVGFPYETDERFQNTYNLAKEIKFDKIHVFRYSSRPGTYAQKYKYEINSKIIKQRVNKLLYL